MTARLSGADLCLRSRRAQRNLKSLSPVQHIMLIPSCQNLALLAVWWMASIPGLAALPEPHARLEFIAEQPAVRPGEPLWIGVLFHLEQGWHIYWENPGDSGEPPKIHWQVPRGFTIGQIRWPQPVRLGSGSIVDYGYEGSVLLITRLAASSSAAAAVPEISADVKYIVCREVCVPGNTHLTLVFPPTENAAERHALFEQARQELPKPAPTAWKVVAQSGHGSFTLSVGTGSRVQSAGFFPLVPGQIENSARQDFVSTSDGFRLTLRKSDQLMKPIAVLKGLVVLGPGRAFEVAAPVSSRQGQS